MNLLRAGPGTFCTGLLSEYVSAEADAGHEIITVGSEQY